MSRQRDSSTASAWTLAELSEQAGLPPRTIRYYIARGLLPGPTVPGRNARYSEEHLARLKRIRELQAKGLVLEEIARVLAGVEDRGLPRPVTWESYALAEDVVVLVRAGAPPWRRARILRGLETFAARVRDPKGGPHDPKDDTQSND